jgi:soluble lytic murein transglycosylase-like protein
MARLHALLHRIFVRFHPGLQAAFLVGCAIAIGWASATAAHASAALSRQSPAATSMQKEAQHFRLGSTLSFRAQYCLGQSAAFHGVNADILHAIILVESDGRPLVVNRNRNGTLDIGMAQINSIHLPELARYGIKQEHLFDECIAAFVAGWHYARQVRHLGNTWQAIGAYHSRTPHLNEAYQRRVMRRLVQLGVWAPTQAAAGLPHTNIR